MTESYVILTLRFFQEEGQWVGDCEELGVAHASDTLDEVRAGLVELLTLTLDTMDSVGEQERYFAEHGITLHPSDRPAPTQEYHVLPDTHLVEPKRIPIVHRAWHKSTCPQGPA